MPVRMRRRSLFATLSRLGGRLWSLIGLIWVEVGLVFFELAVRLSVWGRRRVGFRFWFGFWFWFLVWFGVAFAGIRDMTYPFTRRPCAGRHLLSLPPQRK